MSRLIVITSLLAVVQACAQRPWMSEAQTGSLPNLKRYVEVAAARHQFGKREVEKLAVAVAEREISTADDRGAYERIIDLGPCISELYWPLLRQARRQTETGAAANLLLLEWGWMDSSVALRALRDAADGAWRAVGIRAAQSASHRSDVRRALLDPDPRVRRAAVMAMRAEPLMEDGPPLLDVARLDPEGDLRVLAVGTLGETGDAQSMLLLYEHWDTMDEPSRLALLQALDAPPMRRRLGVELLSRVMQHDDAMTGVVAASLLYRSHSAASGLALGRLLRALRSGTSSEQLLALATLGLPDANLEPELAKLGQEGAHYVRVVALELLLNAGGKSDEHRKRLDAIATSGDPDATEANRVLAMRGDQRAIAHLQKRLTAARAADRLAASVLLVRLEQWNAVALALTDDHPAVRLPAACHLLAAVNS